MVTSSDYRKKFDEIVLERLSLQAPAQSDVDFNVTVTLETCGSYTNSAKSFLHPIAVLARADVPQVVANPSVLSIIETETVALKLTVARSVDDDGSETLIVDFTLDPSQGTIEGVSTSLVRFIANSTTGVYSLMATGGDAASREALLNAYFSSSFLTFRPTAALATSILNEAVINITLRSVEIANGVGTGLAFENSEKYGTKGDYDTKQESVMTTIRISAHAKPSSSPSSKPSRAPSRSPSAGPTTFSLHLLCDIERPSDGNHSVLVGGYKLIERD